MNATPSIQTNLTTPMGAYLRLRGPGPNFLLESVDHGRLGRHSLVGCGNRTVDVDAAEREVAAGRAVVGYIGYDHAARLEPVPLPRGGLGVSPSKLIVADVLVRFDHVTGTADVLIGDPDEVAVKLAAPDPAPEQSPPSGSGGPTRRFPASRRYRAMVRRVQKHIRKGDAYQVVVSMRAERPTPATPVELYLSLRRINPSPYMFLIELDDIALIGSSPETLVKLEGDRASVNPIAGTVPRGDGDAERLLASEKDRAEHVMLVDLGRNDLSRVCEAASVRVERFLEPERYSHVTHLVSEVTGRLRPGVGPFDLLRACFPAGTVTGAPKVRAMQIISTLERRRRGVYAGAVGYALPDGTLDTCIAIRTIVLRDGIAHLQAGAGIVADSNAEMERQECLHKLAALEQALVQAEGQP